MSSPSHPPQINLALGISIGLLASFIQSLGLTIQRKSHLQDELLPPSLRKPDYARPVWWIGFTIYFTFNILGSIFQIGTLPLIILGPLGAISLLWNAILARILLGVQFSIHLVFGTILIGLGALLIGIFGLLPDQSTSHNLNQLIYLYSRTPFLIEIFILVFTFSIICSFAHLYESRLNQSLDSISLLTISPSPPSNQQLPPTINPPVDQDQLYPSSNHRSLRNQVHHYPAYRPRSISSPTYLHSSYPLSISFSQQPSNLNHSDIPLTPPSNPHQTQSHPFFHSSKSSDQNHPSLPVQLSIAGKDHLKVDCHHELLHSTQQKIDQLKFMIGIAYGSTSGTLSGICLLFAKTGVELLIRTLAGTENEFNRVETWIILLVLLISALLQLWYLNKALRLVNPTLICPLAFCFYNLSSIISSLVYYDQIKLLSAFQVFAISMGTTILLVGVWIVSNGTNNTNSSKNMVDEVKEDEDDDQGSVVCEDEVTPLLRSSSRIEDVEEEEEEDEDDQVVFTEEPMDLSFHNQNHKSRRLDDDDDADTTLRIQDRPRRSLQLDSRSSASKAHPFDHLIRQFLVDGHVTPVRGFSFGLGAASPGFAIRPKPRSSRISDHSNRPQGSRTSFHSPHPHPHPHQQREEPDLEASDVGAAGRGQNR